MYLLHKICYLVFFSLRGKDQVLRFLMGEHRRGEFSEQGQGEGKSRRKSCFFKGCVCYIFASLFFESKLEHLSNWERCFLFHFKSSFLSQKNQILEFYILKFHDVIKCLSIKQEIHFTE